jgi:hypothetical protein
MFETINYKKTTQNSIKRINDIISVKISEVKNIIDKDNYHYKPIIIKKVLSNDLCDYIVNIAEQTALKQSTESTVGNIKGWRTTRHANYPTTDLPVNEIPELNILVKNIIQYNVFPHIEENYKVDKRLLYLNDLFIVKYEAFNQNELKKHKDGSVFSFSILLNAKSNFDGGGTIFYNKDDEEMIYENTKGDVLIHPGRVNHAGRKITRGVRYILVGFVKYGDLKEEDLILNKTHILYDFKTNNSNNLNINTFEVKSELITEMYESIKNGPLINESKMLDMIKEKFTCCEKYIYDMFIFHMTRLNLLDDIDNYYVEYWTKTYDRKTKKNPILHAVHIDKDEHLFKTTKKLVTPFLGTVTYLSGDNLPSPTVIINNNPESIVTNACVNLKNGLALSFPKKCKHISFNASNYHTVYDLSAFDVHADNDQDIRITLLFNIWQKQPTNIKLDSSYESTLEQIYTKNDKITEIITTHDELTITIKSIEMYDLLKNMFKQNDMKRVFEFICKRLPNDKDKLPAIVYFDIKE